MLDDSIGPGFVGIDHSKEPFPMSKADNLPSNVETNSNLKSNFDLVKLTDFLGIISSLYEDD